MADLHFFTGTMDSGKSTLALQTNHNHAVRGRLGRMFTSHDRAGEALVSSRLGLTHDAIEVAPDFDFWRFVVDSLTGGARIDYLICDEAQFYTRRQVDQLAKIVDELQIEVFCFGILTDFRTELFPAPLDWSSWPTPPRCSRSRHSAGAASGPPTTPAPRTA